MLPLALSEVNTPTEVILACALPVTVAAVLAEVAVFAVLAKVAKATVPLTLAPVMFDSADPLPMK